jgi:hypothetical protein
MMSAMSALPATTIDESGTAIGSSSPCGARPRRATAPFSVATAAFPLATAAFPVATAASLLATAASLLATAAFPLATAAFPLATAAFPLATAAFPLATTAFPLATASSEAATTTSEAAAAALGKGAPMTTDGGRSVFLLDGRWGGGGGLRTRLGRGSRRSCGRAGFAASRSAGGGAAGLAGVFGRTCVAVSPGKSSQSSSMSLARALPDWSASWSRGFALPAPSLGMRGAWGIAGKDDSRGSAA